MSRQEPASGLLHGPAVAGLWPQDTPSDVRAFLDRNPPLRDDKDAVLDLAYDEYCRLVESGETPDAEVFCARFPTFQSSLRRVIQAHDYLVANPALLEEKEKVPWPIEGETFLGFRLLRELGRGSFARVFLAAEPDLGDRLVAVKVSPHGGTEAQTLGRLDHPNVVKVHAVRKDERSGLTAVCMPYLGAATLDGILSAFATGRPRQARVILDAARATPGPEVTAGDRPPSHPLLEKGSYAEGVCLLGAQLADALAFLHRRDIFHRDLKPSNVLLCPDGRPMLLDFNLSADPEAGRERLGGTLPYMSPEQVLATFGPDRATAAPVDARSDLFSLGVILFELLTGRQPFGEVPRGVPGEEDCAALLARQKEGAPSLRRLCPEATPALARVVASCLAFERERRPRDAAAVAAALHRDLAPHRRALRRLLRHPWKLAAAGALTLALASGDVVYLAARPPYAERMLREARTAYAAGDNETALDRADRVLARAPDSVEAYVLRGRVAQRQGRFRVALKEFREANRLAPDARLTAGIAYCLSREGDQPGALVENERAIEGEFRTAAVYNNLAYSQLNTSRRRDARENLGRALASVPPLPAACHNRLVLLRQEVSEGERGRLAEVRPAITAAVATCPESAELYGNIADLCAAAGKLELERGWDADALTHLKHAHRLGLYLGGRTWSPLYLRFELNKHPAFRNQSVPVVNLPTARLVDPLAD
ncbi:MAG TPA: protein kinase [Gemmataceae bacterium]|nr:protein kinase [Gemmataceae bacterium]